MVKIYSNFLGKILGLLTIIVIFLRIYTSQSNFLNNNLWAEDGLFTLCYLKDSKINCLLDSYSGYLVIYPRLISLLVYKFPLEYWPLLTNILYFLIIFFIMIYLFPLLTVFTNKFNAFVVLIIPFILSISSDQILLVHSSLYLIITAYLIIVFSNLKNIQEISRRKKIILIFVTFILITSNPVGFIVLGIIILHLMKYPKIIRKNLDYLIFTSAGGFLQLMVILNSSENRASLTDFELILKNSFNYLIKSLISIFYYRQDLRLDDPIFLQQKFVTFMYSYHYFFIVLFVLILLVPILSRNNKYSKILPLIIIFFSNLVTLIISSYTLGWPYRFLVLNSTLIFWIIICFTDLIPPKKVSLVLKINLVLLVTYNLLFNFGVTKYRVEGPNWSSEVKSKKVECINDKYEKEIFITFNPNWPTKNPHVHGLVEPTTNKISCQDFFNFSSR